MILLNYNIFRKRRLPPNDYNRLHTKEGGGGSRKENKIDSVILEQPLRISCVRLNGLEGTCGLLKCKIFIKGRRGS